MSFYCGYICEGSNPLAMSESLFVRMLFGRRPQFRCQEPATYARVENGLIIETRCTRHAGKDFVPYHPGMEFGLKP